MKKSDLKKKDLEEVSEKKSNRKAMIIFVLVMAVIFVIVWFGSEYLISKSMISTSKVSINGKERTILFSQKISSKTSQARREDPDAGAAHYGYFIELREKGSDKSLDELKFKAPTGKIDQTPELIINPNGLIWVVSTTDSYDRESPGFVLKFLIKEDKIEQLDFEIDEKYRIRSVRGNKVMLSLGTNFYSTISPAPLYLDLETSQVVDERK